MREGRRGEGKRRGVSESERERERMHVYAPSQKK